MRNVLGLSVILISLGGCTLSTPEQKPSPTPSVSPSAKKDIQYKSYTLGQSVIYTLFIPTGSHFSVIPAISPKVSTLEHFADKHQALAVINGGFFDPQNQKSTSYVIRQNILVANPRFNKRLINNPNLAPYLEKIFNRTEFRRYRCDQMIRYDIARHTDATPKGCQLVDALGGGPQLLPELTSLQEGFLDITNGKVIRDPLSSRLPNARSAVGITHDGDIVLVMVAQMSTSPTTSGLSLTALADFLKTLGVEKAMNLDGGSSASFYYNGKTFYGKVDEQGNSIKRNVLSVLLVRYSKP